MSLVNATRSELSKQFTTSMWWVLAIVLVLWVGSTAAGLAGVFGAEVTGALGGSDAGAPTGIDESFLPPVIYSSATAVGYVFPLIVGVLLVTGEFRHKTLTPTFLATPRRGIALTGKSVAAAVVGVLYAVIALVSTVAPGAGILAAFGIDTQLGESDTWAMLGRIVIAFVLWTLVGVGVGALVRNQVAGVVGVIVFTQFLEPILRFAASLVDGLDELLQFLPGAASDALVGQSIYTAMSGGQGAALEWWAGGLVLLGYAVVLLVLGHLFSWRRDVS